MEDSDKMLYDSYDKRSRLIGPNEKVSMYYIYCVACNKYKAISASAPAGPGGTLSCPMCRIKKENGPQLERSYGRIKVKRIIVTLPEDLED